MNEEQSRLIREREQQREESEHENREELRLSYQVLANLEYTLGRSWNAATIGIIPSVAWVLRESVLRSEESLIEGAATAILGMLGIGIAFVLVPTPCGLVAHYWFRHSARSSKAMATAMVLGLDAAILGWAIWLLHR